MKASPEHALKLAKLSVDCGFLITHLIRQADGLSDSDARKRLLSILDASSDSPAPVLKASNSGWYSTCSGAYVYDPDKSKMTVAGETPVVCFTEATLNGLQGHKEVFNAKYGIAFDRDWIFKKGANPCINIRDDIFKKTISQKHKNGNLYNWLPRDLHPFVNIINTSFDATHEREWRHSGDFNFRLSDVMFVFCPQKDFRFLSALQTNGRPVLFDLDWLSKY